MVCSHSWFVWISSMFRSSAVAPNAVLLALGRIAHDAVLRALGRRPAGFAFAHGAEHALGQRTLIDSYHCSRYNTQTRRLTAAMFEAVFTDIAQHLKRVRS